MQYCTTVCSVLHVNTAASVFKFLFALFLSEYWRKHDTESGNPNQRTLLTLARLWPSTKTPFKKRFIAFWLYKVSSPIATLFSPVPWNDVIGQFYRISKTYFFHIKHLWPPSPNRPVAETAAQKRHRRTVLDPIRRSYAHNESTRSRWAKPGSYFSQRKDTANNSSMSQHLAEKSVHKRKEDFKQWHANVATNAGEYKAK